MDISPDKQNIDRVFSNTVYHIDFYQRDYRWTEEPVLRLLSDTFYHFNERYPKHKDLDPSPETVATHYPWYYLNTYVTNSVDGRVYVVDGQQRLTTLTLILIKLKRQAQALGSELQNWLDGKIAGHAGYKAEFWMNHERHRAALEGLYQGKDPDAVDTKSGLTAQNMVANFQAISTWLDQELTDQHKLDTFVFYFLQRLVLINLAVEQTDVPMVFEVINDRGVRLRPYEILKGKLLGQIDKQELDKQSFNELWEHQLQAVNDYREDEADSFFRAYLKAKFSPTRKAGQRFDGDYHREMFKSDLQQQLQLERNPVGVKSFLNAPFRWYTDLYARVWALSKDRDSAAPAVFYGALNELDGRFMLVLSACGVADPEREQKIARVAFELDRMFTLLQLQNSYDSNSFTEAQYRISEGIREKPVAEIRPVFDEEIMKLLSERRNVEVDKPLQWAYFRNASIEQLNIRFTRYFFARIEDYLAAGSKVEMRHPFKDIVTRGGAVNGFHIEHILARNPQNAALFASPDEFEQQRNRLGAVLLLKGRDNQSSGAECYSDKRQTYANTMLWNETLRDDFYKSKLDLKDLIAADDLPLAPLDTFGPEEIEQRQRCLFRMVECIWNRPVDIG